MSGETLPGVSRTAVWVAALRSAESKRADRLFDDELAGAFVSAAGSGAAPDISAMPPGSSEFLAIRTRFFDDQALAACAAGIRQVVLLAAGLDGRAFRLDWPAGVRLYELDLAETFAFKEPVLASAGAVARCARVVVAADLRGQWKDTLTAAGFDPDVATVWLAEGLVQYLDDEQSSRLLATVSELSAPGSRAVFDYLEAAAADQPAVRQTSDVVRRMGTELQLTAESPADWLAAKGWQTGLSRVPAMGEHYDRPLPAEVDMVSSNATALITASR